MEGFSERQPKTHKEEGLFDDWLKEVFSQSQAQENGRDYLAEEIESVGTYFKKVCDHIATSIPDRVIFLDAGARTFGIPFVKYMRMRHDQKWRAEYWDDDRLRSGNQDIDLDLLGQHLVFIDDVIWNGRNLRAVENLAKEKGFTYEYTALSKHPSHERRLNFVDELPEYSFNDHEGQYFGGNIAGKQRNSLYIRDAEDSRKQEVRNDVEDYQKAILETMLKGDKMDM